ncbi:hypothetical protein A1O1_00149 [Capronia coronata CBS 617.96]|uniref:37S ribosomal protein mrp10, mitochondrial n=1 Tax=Capronia coronata CBS 617.96 TaxID=1182541 RepID=W9Z0E1_9EURO|nr:uncharacterized protein A1O1_00149 [Capronia coronata CBS 617.96]EXJ95031.1 hypothetical protein A1O1_00149 [Capronia coronata CBS 617.96]
MPPKGASTAVNPIRLQTVSRLKIRNPDKQEPNPCLGPMSAMLNCWAAGAASGGCGHLEKALRDCMDAPSPPPKAKSTINYHLGRLYPNISGPKKKT